MTSIKRKGNTVDYQFTAAQRKFVRGKTGKERERKMVYRIGEERGAPGASEPKVSVLSVSTTTAVEEAPRSM